MNDNRQTLRRPLVGAVAGLLLACGFGGGLSAVAQEEKDETAAREIPTQVDAILHSMSDFLGSTKGLGLRAEILHDDAISPGTLIQRSATLEIVIERPGGFHGVLAEDGEVRKIWSDGKTATIFDVTDNVFTRTKVPGEIGPTLDFMMERYGLSMPLADFLFEKPYEALTGKVERAFYVGLTEVDGVTCHHLAFTQDAIDWQLWVEAGVRPAPRRLVINYKLLPGCPRYMATMADLELGAATHPGRFVPILPDDAEEIGLIEIETAKRSK